VEEVPPLEIATTALKRQAVGTKKDKDKSKGRQSDDAFTAS
jgi:hypothetical protein